MENKDKIAERNKERGFPRTSNYNKLWAEGYDYLNSAPEFKKKIVSH